MRVDRELALEDCRSHEDDPGPTVGSEAAGEVERMLRLLPIEQRHDDGAIGDRPRPACEAPGTVTQDVDVWELHFRSWYGTEARITFGSKSRSRLR